MYYENIGDYGKRDSGFSPFHSLPRPPYTAP
jgi:hypothetical protein